jgi:hypothetical protein
MREDDVLNVAFLRAGGLRDFHPTGAAGRMSFALRFCSVRGWVGFERRLNFGSAEKAV